MKWVLVMTIESQDGETVAAKSVTSLGSQPLPKAVVAGGTRLARNLLRTSNELFDLCRTSEVTS